MASSPDDLIKLKVVPTAHEAAAVMQSLRDRGITAHLEQPAGLTDCLTMASPMFEVSVRRADLVAARNLVAGDRPVRIEWSLECEQCSYSLEGLRAPARCPECGWNAADHGRAAAEGSMTRTLAQARAKFAPRATGRFLIVTGAALMLVGIAVALTGPHSVRYVHNWHRGWGGAAFTESSPLGSPYVPGGYNVGITALILLGLVITLLGVRDLHRR